MSETLKRRESLMMNRRGYEQSYLRMTALTEGALTRRASVLMNCRGYEQSHLRTTTAPMRYTLKRRKSLMINSKRSLLGRLRMMRGQPRPRRMPLRAPAQPGLGSEEAMGEKLLETEALQLPDDTLATSCEVTTSPNTISGNDE